MMVLIFSVLLLAVILAWIGYRKSAQYIFAAIFVVAIIWFNHHMTSQLTIEL